MIINKILTFSLSLSVSLSLSLSLPLSVSLSLSSSIYQLVDPLIVMSIGHSSLKRQTSSTHYSKRGRGRGGKEEKRLYILWHF